MKMSGDRMMTKTFQMQHRPAQRGPGKINGTQGTDPSASAKRSGRGYRGSIRRAAVGCGWILFKLGAIRAEASVCHGVFTPWSNQEYYPMLIWMSSPPARDKAFRAARHAARRKI
jgi:hypothetical protein